MMRFSKTKPMIGDSIKKHVHFILIILILIFIMPGLTACENPDPGSITLSTTTSTENSGLLDEILPSFTEETGIEVKVIAVGTGAALDMGRGKDADVVLVHAYDAEMEFVEQGYGTERYSVMYNDFILAGPPGDPAEVNRIAPDNILDALQRIWDVEASFVSRGDSSGTHIMEQNLLDMAGLIEDADFYVSAGQGMGAVLEMADEMSAYTLTDRGTYLSMMGSLDLIVVTEGDELLFNPYGVIPVTQDDGGNINTEGAQKFVEWLISDETQKRIGEFGVDIFGEPLFIPDAD